MHVVPRSDPPYEPPDTESEKQWTRRRFAQSPTFRHQTAIINQTAEHGLLPDTLALWVDQVDVGFR